MSLKHQEVGEYKLLSTLGSGSTGKVKLAEHKTTHRQVAIKIIKKAVLEFDPEFQDKNRQEIALMRLMDHPHILRLEEILESQRHLYLVLEYASHGDLFEYLQSRGTLSLAEAMPLFRQTIFGLDYLHVHSIAHRDLKLENILLDETNSVKIADFGFAKWMRANVAETSCGSPHYAAPEVIQGLTYDGRKADIWSLGVILYALLTGRLPFDEASLRELANRIRSGTYRMPDFPEPVKDLISKMLTVDPEKRISMVRLKRHPALREGLPPRYTFPAPLPLPSTKDPIDPATLQEDILGILNSIGFKSESDLFSDLRSNEGTLAKAFCVILTGKNSLDSLPWPDEDPMGDGQTVIEIVSEPVLPAQFNFAFNDDDGFEGLVQSLGDDSTSLYSYAEKAAWDPRTANFEERSTTVSRLTSIPLALEVVVAEIQAALNTARFNWFYPNDVLIVARRLHEPTDIAISVSNDDDSRSLSVAISCLEGSSAVFATVVAEIASGIDKVARK